MPIVPFEHLCQCLATSIEMVWESEWRRNDLALELTRVYSKDQLKAMANSIGRSHQDIIRWAALAAHFSPDVRRRDRSPREHARIMNGGTWKDESPTRVSSQGPNIHDQMDGLENIRRGYQLGNQADSPSGVAPTRTRDARKSFAPRTSPRTSRISVGPGPTPFPVDLQTRQPSEDHNEVGPTSAYGE